MAVDREGTRPPPSSRDVAGEDFLFHLYRGSELLQDNRVHDAKAELEQALSLQPSDPKGQDLLGIVYFRLGLYPRAIAIYQQLILGHPDAIEPRINLALSYLKTGQPAHARAELERVLEAQPNHGRAWGYLGLAFQRMGDYERASHAFQAGGHEAMAKRILEMMPVASTSGAGSLRPETGKADVRRAAREAFQEIDRADSGAFRPDAELRRQPSGTWSAIEPGRESEPHPQLLVPSLAATPSRPPSNGEANARELEGEDEAVPPAPRVPSAIASVAPSIAPEATTSPRAPADVARDLLLVFPRDRAVALHGSGLVLVQAQAGFATRLEAVRSMTTGLASQMLPRRTRGRALDEPLGGVASPLVELDGKGDLVLGPSAGKRLFTFALSDEPLYFREDALVGFDLSVGYENGRLPVGDGEAIGMVQLRGPGAAVVELPERVRTLEVSDAARVAVRAFSVVGWIGRVVPRALLASEAPAGARGFVAFAGEGMVVVDGR